MRRDLDQDLGKSRLVPRCGRSMWHVVPEPEQTLRHHPGGPCHSRSPLGSREKSVLQVVPGEAKSIALQEITIQQQFECI